jgi:hypothetical protein
VFRRPVSRALTTEDVLLLVSVVLTILFALVLLSRIFWNFTLFRLSDSWLIRALGKS